MNNIILEYVEKKDICIFKNKLQESFIFGAKMYFGENIEDKVPEEKDIEESLSIDEVHPYHLILNNEKVGGAVIETNDKTNNNELHFFFIYPEYQNKKIGYSSWKAIENKYPQTKTWICYTPYFEKRNINFYVNKCGFCITAFYNEHNKLEGINSGPKEFFKFEKAVN
ncbi:GNAT family N-acetyltransferase [uncultured Brachyspira sp.]|uniref:GNAT family N-acetyltransferase n=1 Tax=uncultured Brachyspira sp. TaxID=221953 RepID=UPI0025D94F8A|nr:GNAT family N-acetyltransferase [uncultured Brachyspira sp.]